MAEATDKQGIFLQNLKDAGCSEEKIHQCCEYVIKNEIDELQRFLKNYRRELLKNLHVKQKEIDCLDYLLFQLAHQGGI